MRPLIQAQLPRADLDAVQAAAAALRRSHAFVSRIVLFGSKARGEAMPESDVDLLVLTSRPVTREQRHAVTGTMSTLGRDLGVVYSTLVVDEDSWARGVYRVLPIRREIERDGIAA